MCFLQWWHYQFYKLVAVNSKISKEANLLFSDCNDNILSLSGFSLLPLLQVEPVKKTLTEGTSSHHQEALLYNNLPSSDRPHIPNIRTLKVKLCDEPDMEVNGFKLYEEMWARSQPVGCDRDSISTIIHKRQPQPHASWSKTISHHSQTDKQQSPVIEHFVALSTTTTQDALTPMQNQCSYLWRHTENNMRNGSNHFCLIHHGVARRHDQTLMTLH